MAADTKINDLVTMALRRNIRKNTDVDAIIKDRATAFIKSTLRKFPFWFLHLEPGYQWAEANLPITDANLVAETPLSITGYASVDYWLDRGLLRTEDGKSDYALFAPAENVVGDITGAYWFPSKCQKPLYAHTCNLTTGEKNGNITLNTQYNVENQVQLAEGMPCVGYIISGREYDTLKLVPTPDKAYLVKIAWVMQESPTYYLDPGDVAGENWTSKFLQEYEEVTDYIIRWKAAEYFGDLKQIQYYQRELFGADKEARNIMDGGMIGDMKKEHLRKNRSKSYTIPTYRSNPNPSGSGRRRYPGDWPGYYAL